MGELSANELIDLAYQRLLARPGFVLREDQRQVSLLLSDCIAEGSRGAFEAPTGLGKSLACLIPAIAHALANNTRVIIATYTNILAEQYWRTDLPLALSLFDSAPKTSFLIGRTRYACMAALQETNHDAADAMALHAELGIESEFRKIVNLKPRENAALWSAVSTPPVCPGRLCDLYSSCYYYRARRQAEKAEVVITNHSVVLQDALMRRASESALSLLGNYGYVIFDEAHDLLQSVPNALEFELSEAKLNLMMSLSAKIERAMENAANAAKAQGVLHALCEGFRKDLTEAAGRLRTYQSCLGAPGILSVSPESLRDHPQIKSRLQLSRLEIAEAVALEVADTMERFTAACQELVRGWEMEGRIDPNLASSATDSILNYDVFLRDFALGCRTLFTQDVTGITYVDSVQAEPRIRYDVIDFAPLLQELLWDVKPAACMSATLAIDGSLEFFNDSLGFTPDFLEILPSPFDFSTQAALYAPAPGAIPDPSEARKLGQESQYFDAIARELTEIITLMRGRTLALFHSRREMEEVHRRMRLSEEYPILMQSTRSASYVGEQFKKNIASSLFALRSFWTGFDAPGETLSCVALVRVPFQVPVDPAQVAKHAWLQQAGKSSFSQWTLPHAKMLVRQGVGRLIRNDQDRGLICLLDPRIRGKQYGAEILENLPPGMREYSDVSDAIGWLGLG